MNPVRTGVVAVLALLAGPAAGEDVASVACSPLSLPVENVGPPPGQYSDYCARQPLACAMTGPAVVTMSATLLWVLSDVNSQVNGEFRFMPDAEWRGQEEVWSRPVLGCGDCEDFALEKRERLAARGVPRAAMTMAIAHHKTGLFAHALLLVETSAGTFVLDNRTDALTCWRDAPYYFETRERPDGRWTRFDQRAWK